MPKAKESARVNDTDRSRIDGLNELEVTEKILCSVISLKSTLEKTHEKSWICLLSLISVLLLSASGYNAHILINWLAHC